MSSNRNQKRGKYLKGCYHSKKAAALGYDYRPDLIYEFAVEYKNFKDFISEYSSEHEGYSFVESKERETQKQTNNVRNFCVRCKNGGLASYGQCDYRRFVEDENVIAIALADEADTGGAYCNNCNKRVFFSDHCREKAKSTVQDVRLHERPTKITISRLRYYCPHCHTFIGMKYLPDLQAYCGGGMTARLAASVLLSQLSAVKREYIAEAYGLSKSQIDRIKSRMIDQAKEGRMHLAWGYIETNRDSDVICKVFKDSKSGHVYYTYFLKTKAGELHLINLLTQADRDAVLSWKDGGVSKRFPDTDGFSLEYRFVCYCILAGEKNMRGTRLKEKLEQLVEWYNQYKDKKRFTNSYYQDKFESYTKAVQPQELLRREDLSRIETLSDLTYSKQSGTANISYSFFTNAADPDSNSAIVSFFSTLISELKQINRVSSSEFINRLLYFNPAVIRKEEVKHCVEGTRFGLSAAAFYLENNRSTPPPFGTPLSCLEYFIKNGLLRDKNTRLIPCRLTQTNAEDQPAEQPEHPCGLSCATCPHLVKE